VDFGLCVAAHNATADFGDGFQSMLSPHSIGLSVWLAQLVIALAAPTHVHSCDVQEARV